jgi:hypothetical protein
MQAMNEGYYPAWYHAVEAFLLLIAAAIATVMLGGDIRAAVAEETRAALAAAHDDTCQKLGLGPVRSHPEFARCVNLLVQLQGTHERFADARHGQ